jgi:hypothetical protein
MLCVVMCLLLIPAGAVPRHMCGVDRPKPVSVYYSCYCCCCGGCLFEVTEQNLYGALGHTPHERSSTLGSLCLLFSHTHITLSSLPHPRHMLSHSPSPHAPSALLAPP